MILYVSKWNIRPEKREAYAKWAEGAIRRTMKAPGIAEFRGYRPATGSHEVAVTYEFPDMAAFNSWITNEEVQRLLVETRSYCENVTSELWGPSPLVPKPVPRIS
jgi:antibiotic biosynthesis monooxygenase (ABM) superfamily enzyme